MKRKGTPLFRIGLFVVGGFIVLTVFIFFIGSKQKLFTSTSVIYARFATVNSLKTGAQVQMAGINVGNVTSIKLPLRGSDSVSVTMKIEEDALPLIHSDSRALITTEGLIGDKFILITLGGDSTLALKPGSFMRGEPEKEFGRIYDTLNAAVSQVNKLTFQAVEILKSVRTGQGSIGKLIYDNGLYEALEGLTAEAKQSVDQMSTGVSNLTGSLDTIAKRVNRGEGSIGKFLNNNDFYVDVKSTAENLRSSSADLRDAMAKLALGTGRFAEDAEALKHNFLFKGYFEDRGFWDAPDFEQTIDRKIDSLNRLNQKLDDQLRQLRMLNAKRPPDPPSN